MELPVTPKPGTAPEKWVDLYGDALYGYALSRLQDPSVAEDLVQETFLAALGALKNFKGHSSIKTWLTGILKHKIMDHLRRKYREAPREYAEPDGQNRDGFFDEHGAWKRKPTKWAADPHRLVQQQQFMETLFKCLAGLSEQAARAFVFREMEGMSTEELCKVLEISATNSWVILHRARMKLRHCLEVNWFATEEKEES
jgi:RNA polymerase sigma-70 factor (ECF subfamily)